MTLIHSAVLATNVGAGKPAKFPMAGVIAEFWCATVTGWGVNRDLKIEPSVDDWHRLPAMGEKLICFPELNPQLWEALIDLRGEPAPVEDCCGGLLRLPRGAVEFDFPFWYRRIHGCNLVVLDDRLVNIGLTESELRFVLRKSSAADTLTLLKKKKLTEKEMLLLVRLAEAELDLQQQSFFN